MAEIRVFGPGCSAAEIDTALDADPACTAIVLGGDPDELRDLIDDDRLFYVSRGELPENERNALIEGARGLGEGGSPLLHVPSLRRIATAQSLTELAEAVRGAIVRATDAEGARCALFDRERNVLWTPGESDFDTGESAAVGLASFVLRTGMTVCLPRMGDDPRYDCDLDGNPSHRFLAARAGDAVLVALRSAGAPPFEPRERAALDALAVHTAPYLMAWMPSDTPFRVRAAERPHASPEPLRLEPWWSRRASWLAAATVLAAAAAAALTYARELAP